MTSARDLSVRSALKGLGVLPVMLAMVISVSACNKTQIADSPPEPGDVAVARLDGHTIWTSDVRAEAVTQGEIGPGEPLDMTSDLFRRTLQEVIDQRLLAKAARDKGLDKSLAAQRRLQAVQDRLLGDMLVNNTIDRDIDDKAVKAQYDEQVKLAKTSEEIRTRIMVLKTKEDAEAALKQVQGGAVFEALAMEKSLDQATRYNGGDMGYFTTDIMPQAFKTVIPTAKVGDTVGPVQTDGGWAILRIEDRRPEQLPTLEEERPVIMRYLIYNQVAGLLTNLQNNSKIEFLLPKTAVKEDEKEPDSAPAGALSGSGADSADADSEDDSADTSSSTSSSATKLKPVAMSKPLGKASAGASSLIASDPVPAGHHFFAPAGASTKSK